MTEKKDTNWNERHLYYLVKRHRTTYIYACCVGCQKSLWNSPPPTTKLNEWIIVIENHSCPSLFSNTRNTDKNGDDEKTFCDKTIITFIMINIK